MLKGFVSARESDPASLWVVCPHIIYVTDMLRRSVCGLGWRGAGCFLLSKNGILHGTIIYIQLCNLQLPDVILL